MFLFRNRFTLQQYRAINDNFDNPFIFKLTGRGFFSEVNNLLNAIVFGLLTQRRILVDQTMFQGMVWSDFFDADLPSVTTLPSIDPEWIIRGVESRHFGTIREWVFQRWQQRERFDITSLGLKKIDIFTLRKKNRRIVLCSTEWPRPRLVNISTYQT